VLESEKQSRGVWAMLFKESETVELKVIATVDIKKEVIASANSGGGSLYVGIADNGEVIGLDDAEADLTNINNMLYDGIKPDITQFVQAAIKRVSGKKIILLAVQGGTERPYYLSGKGIRPGGVFVRHGTQSVPATDTAIRKMIRETDGESYEKLRSTEQNLTFEVAGAEFAKRNIPFGPAQKAALGLTNSDGIHANLARLLSEQCRHTIKAAVFQDATQQIFRDRREFSGPLFEQINEAFDFLSLHNATAATFDGLLRIDKPDYPQAALREALLNSVVHREYAAGGSILIKIFSDRVEFISPGSLVSGLELEDIMSGYSACRNPMLAAVFYRLQLIEAYGTGILKIFECYKTSHKQPKIEVTPNVFKMALPNLNSPSPKQGDCAPGPQKRVLDFVGENGSISRKQAQELLGISQTAAGLLLRKMVTAGKLAKEGGSRHIRYAANKA
jgi:ATP-dependent DNA helicase RecG